MIAYLRSNSSDHTRSASIPRRPMRRTPASALAATLWWPQFARIPWPPPPTPKSRCSGPPHRTPRHRSGCQEWPTHQETRSPKCSRSRFGWFWINAKLRFWSNAKLQKKILKIFHYNILSFRFCPIIQYPFFYLSFPFNATLYRLATFLKYSILYLLLRLLIQYTLLVFVL